MDRRSSNPLLLAGIFALLAFAPARSALAAPKDAAATKLDSDAINDDYLALKFPDAEKKLRQALTLCAKPGACSPKIIGQVHRDLGILFVVQKKNDDGRAQFVEAIKADPTAALPKDLTTPEVQAVWDAAKFGTVAPPEPAAPATPSAPAAPTTSSGEDIVHTPVAEQAINTPVPIYVETPNLEPAKVQVHYKVFGASDWRALDLKKLRQGYGGEIPCLDVGTTTGDLKYFIQALDTNGDVLATTGTRNDPYKVPIKSELAGNPPHLPGKPPPAQCTSPSDCPPGLPGCGAAKKKGDKGAGATCEEDSECDSGSCKEGACVAPPDGGESKQCTSNADCAAGQSCSGGVCGSPAKKNWLNISLQQDVLFLPATTDVCRTQTDYSCFFNNNKWYDPSDPQNGVPLPGSGDQVKSGGFALATTRVMIGFDRLLTDNVSLGVRLGYAFNGGPQKVDSTTGTNGPEFFAFHVEGRVAYWIGTSPFGRLSLRPYVVLSGGVAQVDAKVVVQVYTKNMNEPLSLATWKKAGNGFVAAGFGAMLPVGPGGITAELKLQQMLGSSATGGALAVGYSHGF